MSELDDAIEEIRGEQLERGRMLLELGDFETATVEDVRGIDLVLAAPGDETAVIARVSWADGDVAADLRLFIDGGLAAHDGVELDGTTSIWATRRE
jgi:hypothetical protein